MGQRRKRDERSAVVLPARRPGAFRRHAAELRTARQLVDVVFEARRQDYLSIDDLGITIHGTDADALERAGELATRCMLRFFDAVLVDRALRRGMPLLTSDRKLANAVGAVAPVEILRGIP